MARFYRQDSSPETATRGRGKRRPRWRASVVHRPRDGLQPSLRQRLLGAVGGLAGLQVSIKARAVFVGAAEGAAARSRVVEELHRQQRHFVIGGTGPEVRIDVPERLVAPPSASARISSSVCRHSPHASARGARRVAGLSGSSSPHHAAGLLLARVPDAGQSSAVLLRVGAAGEGSRSTSIVDRERGGVRHLFIGRPVPAASRQSASSRSRESG